MTKRNLERSEQITPSRLRSGHHPHLKYWLAKINLAADTICRKWGETAEHVIYDFLRIYRSPAKPLSPSTRHDSERSFHHATHGWNGPSRQIYQMYPIPLIETTRHPFSLLNNNFIIMLGNFETFQLWIRDFHNKIWSNSIERGPFYSIFQLGTLDRIKTFSWIIIQRTMFILIHFSPSALKSVEIIRSSLNYLKLFILNYF